MSAIELAAVYVPIIPSLKGSTSAIQNELAGVDTSKVGQKIGSKLGTNIGQGIKTVATGTVTVAATAIGTALVKGFGRLNALDNATNKLNGLGHSAESVEAIMKNALASVRGTAFGMDAAATVAASAVAAGIKPGADLERTLKLVADAATIAGTDMGSMGAIFNKVAASNKVQMDVINQLHDAGVPALASLADYMGVTAEEASKMASKGEISFETFQAAMEKTLGGAAQSSGNTFSGAMANVGAALGRVGAGILGGIFPKLAPLFQGITKALGPFEERAAALGTVIGEKVAPAIDWLTEKLKGGIGEIKLIPQLVGPATGAFVALGASGLAPLLRMVPGLGGLATKLGLLGGPVGLAIATFAGLVAVSPELQGALGSLLAAVTTAGAALAPVLAGVAEVLSGALVGAIHVAIPVVVSIIETFAKLIGWLTDSEAKIQALSVIVGIGAGAWLTYKAALMAISFAGTIKGLATSTKAFAVSTIAKGKDLAVTVALSAMYAKDFVVSAAKATAAVVVSTARWVANTAALMAQKVALVATRVAMGAATAAQWLFNAALAANPIGLVVAAIAALVAGLIWFFTQTELGQKIWAGFMSFLSDTWNNISAIATAVWTGISDFFTSTWEGIVGFATGAWNGLVDFFSGMWEGITSSFSTNIEFILGLFTGWTVYSLIIDNWEQIAAFFSDVWGGIVSAVQSALGWTQGIIVDATSAIAAWWSGLWTGVRDFFVGLWSGIVSTASSAVARVSSVVQNVVSGLAGWWRNTWSGVSSFLSGIWSGMVSAVQGAGRAFGSVFRGIRDAISNAFSGIVGIVKSPINAIIGLVNGAIRGLNRLSINIPDWVPGFGGNSWGISLPEIPMLAQGATVLPRPGGTLAILAEAGRPESVVDTGLLNRALREGLSGEQSGVTVNGPLIEVGHMEVRDESDIQKVAEALHEEMQKANRSKGKVDLEGPVVV